MFVRFSESESFRFKLSQTEFHAAISRYSSESLETLTSLFPPDSHHFMSGPRRQRRPDFDKVEK